MAPGLTKILTCNIAWQSDDHTTTGTIIASGIWENGTDGTPTDFEYYFTITNGTLISYDTKDSDTSYTITYHPNTTGETKVAYLADPITGTYLNSNTLTVEEGGGTVPNITFPPTVQAGSPKYLLVSITPSTALAVGTGYSIVVSCPSTTPAPANNSYYTIQSTNGESWATSPIETWTSLGTQPDGSVRYSASFVPSSIVSTGYTPATGDIVWCVWAKEYYDSLTSEIQKPIEGTHTNPFPASSLAVATSLGDGVYVGTFTAGPTGFSGTGMMTKTSGGGKHYFTFVDSANRFFTMVL